MSASTAAKTGLLLINLGSPAEPTPAAVGRYLRQFLSDPYVIDLPAPIRWGVVHAAIVPFRKGKSAAAYQKIWRNGENGEGSPLVHFTREFAEKVALKMPSLDVRWAMRYGEPSIGARLKDWRINKMYVVPMYPQYAESSTRTALDEVMKQARAHKISAQVLLEDFYDQPEFIQSSVRQIQKHIDAFRPDHLMLSFHGLPEHHMAKLHPGVCLENAHCCDKVTTENRHCYRAQCMATARAISCQLPFDSAALTVSFQSRLGRRPWIQPYTDIEISKLAARGVKRVLVSCPSFVADCLETLEEIQMRLREQFLKDGGSELQLVPALNAEDFWVDSFCNLIRRTEVNLLKIK